MGTARKIDFIAEAKKMVAERGDPGFKLAHAFTELWKKYPEEYRAWIARETAKFQADRDSTAKTFNGSQWSSLAEPPPVSSQGLV